MTGMIKLTLLTPKFVFYLYVRAFKLFDATLLVSSEYHLHYYDFRHSLHVIFLDTKQNKFPINIGSLKLIISIPSC